MINIRENRWRIACAGFDCRLMRRRDFQVSLVGIFIQGFGYSATRAIPISKAVILGVAIGANIVNARKRHPLANRPLIDYTMASMLSPSALLG